MTDPEVDTAQDHDAVTVSVEVRVPPDVAFRVFTEDIDSWYQVDRYTVPDVTRTKAIVFEPWVGGRLLDVHDEETRTGRELARVTAWQPNQRLSFTDERRTEVDVTFTPTALGTLVTLQHRGLSSLASTDPARRYGWRVLLPWYANRLSDPTRTEEEQMSFTGITPHLCYPDAAAALDWLTDKLGFGPDTRWHGEDGNVMEAEISVGPARVGISEKAPAEGEGRGALMIVHLDDVDAEYERFKARGVEADPPRDEVYGPRAMNVTDPWGYRWYFWQGQPVPPS